MTADHGVGGPAWHVWCGKPYMKGLFWEALRERSGVGGPIRKVWFGRPYMKGLVWEALYESLVLEAYTKGLVGSGLCTARRLARLFVVGGLVREI